MRKLKVHYFDFEKYEDDWRLNGFWNEGML